MTILRPALAATLAVGLLGPPLVARAQPAGKVWRIGQLVTTSGSGNTDVLRQRLGELGYIEGQNLKIEHRSAEGRPERLPALAAELVGVNVDLIVTSGTQAALAAKQATSVIPIVMASSGDAVGTGLVQSLGRPGGNVTGTTGISPELSGKRLQLVKEAFPRLSRIAVLWNPGNPLDLLERKETESAARPLSLALQWLEARTADDIERAFATATREHAEILIVFPDPLFVLARRQIVDRAAKYRLPSMWVFRQDAEAGGLMSYGPNVTEQVRRAALYVDKILKGARPGDLPIEQPTRFELVINMKTAKALRLTMPSSLLLRADRVID
ncbi:MAG TPA: ABC transporter substrate-binding protein [Methylomirabilota bacterium]|jgi:putative ABC transport system substrate-binding protein